MSKSLLWSWSTSQMFRKCQRQWYLKVFVASHNASDERRREAYLLSKLQSISAWRGSLVDSVISKQIIPAIKSRRSISSFEAIKQARNLFNAQWEFAMKHRLRQAGFTSSEAGDTFAAFYAIEYGLEVKPEEKAKAWEEVERSISNLFEMDSLFPSLQTTTHLVTQSPITFSLHDVNIRSVPDLIAFYYNKPPTIIDWKVSVFKDNDYRSQLAIYALALILSGPRLDFPASKNNYKPTDLRLIEAQLLSGQLREYALTDGDIEDTEAYILESASQMILALGDEPEDGQFRPFDFPVTKSPDLCGRCNFKGLCWKEKDLWAEWKQTSLL